MDDHSYLIILKNTDPLLLLLLLYPTVYKAVNIIASPQPTTKTALLEGTVSTFTFESYAHFTVHISVLVLKFECSTCNGVFLHCVSAC